MPGGTDHCHSVVNCQLRTPANEVCPTPVFKAASRKEKTSEFRFSVVSSSKSRKRPMNHPISPNPFLPNHAEEMDWDGSWRGLQLDQHESCEAGTFEESSQASNLRVKLDRQF